MASWRDDLLPASFRGVPFFVDRSRYRGGRKAVPHSIPFSEDPPWVEDEGKGDHVFSIEAFIVGPTGYKAARDALLVELEKKGPGTLVHPFYGTLTVQVGDDLGVDETKDEGGCARFSITFHETLPLPAAPTTVTAGPSTLLASAASARSAAVNVFNTINNAISPIRDAVTGALTALSNGMNALSATVSLGPQTAATLASQIVALKNSAVGLAASPGDLVTSVIGTFDTLKSAFDDSDVSNPWSLFLGLYGSFAPGPRPTGSSPDNVLAQTNFDQTVLLIQRVAVVGAAEAVATQAFDSADAAIDARDQIVAAIDALNDAASDDTYPALAQLTSDLVKTLPGDSLPKLLRVTPPGTVPALVLAHRLYTANPSTFSSLADAETDLVKRNRIPNPAFVPAGAPLTVLSDG